MMGMSLGCVYYCGWHRRALTASCSNLAGPPVAGALDQRFGFRGPFILGITITTFEFLCRLLLIEGHEAALWDSSLTRLMTESNASRGRVYGATDAEKRDEQPPQATIQPPADEEIATVSVSEPVAEARAPSPAATLTTPSQPPAQLSILLKLVKSSRAMAPALLTLVFGSVQLSSQFPMSLIPTPRTQHDYYQPRACCTSLLAVHLWSHCRQDRSGVPCRSHPNVHMCVFP